MTFIIGMLFFLLLGTVIGVWLLIDPRSYARLPFNYSRIRPEDMEREGARIFWRLFGLFIAVFCIYAGIQFSLAWMDGRLVVDQQVLTPVPPDRDAAAPVRRVLAVAIALGGCLVALKVLFDPTVLTRLRWSPPEISLDAETGNRVLRFVARWASLLAVGMCAAVALRALYGPGSSMPPPNAERVPAYFSGTLFGLACVATGLWGTFNGGWLFLFPGSYSRLPIHFGRVRLNELKAARVRVMWRVWGLVLMIVSSLIVGGAVFLSQSPAITFVDALLQATGGGSIAYYIGVATLLVCLLGALVLTYWSGRVLASPRYARELRCVFESADVDSELRQRSTRVYLRSAGVVGTVISTVIVVLSFSKLFHALR